MGVTTEELTGSILDKLVDVYHNEEWWHTKKLDKEESRKYFAKLLYQGNIICHIQDGELIAYVEFWRITFEQFGRLICKAPFSAYQENVVDGNIAYVANVWVDEKYRGMGVHTNFKRMMKMEFFNKNVKCDYFVGEALRKKTQPVKVFDRSRFMKLLSKGEESWARKEKR